MRNRARKLDMPHALAAHLRLRHLDTALLAHDAAMLEPLVLAAQAFVVLDWAENLRAEQSVTLRLERSVIDRLRLLDLAVRPRSNHLGRSQADLDRLEIFDRCLLLEELE